MSTPARRPAILIALLLAAPLAAQVTVTTPALANGNLSGAYSQPLAATGGTPPYSWRVASGALPAGIFLDPAGALNGVPLAVGTANVTLEATDILSQAGSQAYTLTVGTGLTLVNHALAESWQFAVYPETMKAAGGTPPYSFAVTAGVLPAGVSLAAGGAFSGAALTAGDFPVTITVTDGDGATASAAYTIKIVTLPTQPEWRARTLFGGRVLAHASPSFDLDGALFAHNGGSDIYSSTDRGLTWAMLPVSNTLATSLPNIGSFALSPNYVHGGPASAEQQTIFISGTGVYRGVYRSTDRGASFNFAGTGLNTGLNYISIALSRNYPVDHTLWAVGWVAFSGPVQFYRSTDSGVSWTLRGTLSLPNSGVLTAARRGDGTNLLFFHNGENLYRSADEGANWTIVLTLPPPSLPSSKFITTTLPSPDFSSDGTILVSDSVQRLFRSTDEGASFAQLTSFPAGMTGCDVGLGVLRRPGAPPMWGCRNNSRSAYSVNYGTSFALKLSHGILPAVRGNFILAGNVNGNPEIIVATDDYGVRASFDAGSTFTKRDRGLSAIPLTRGHVSGSAQAVTADNTQWYLSTDGGQSWTHRNNATNQPSQVLLSPSFATDRRIFMSGSGRIYISDNGGDTFTLVGNLSAGGVLLAPGYNTSTGTVYAWKYTGTPTYAMMRSTNGGSSFTDLTGWPAGSCGTTVNSAVISAVDGTIFTLNVVGGTKLCKSTDGGLSWSSQSFAGNYYGIALSPIYAEAGSNGTREKFVYLTGSGGTDQRSFDGGATWTPVTGQTPSSSPVFISPAFATDGVIYRVGGGGLKRSSDAGATFAPLGAGDDLKARSVMAVLFEPGFNGALGSGPAATVISSFSGFWRSTDGGRTFQSISSTMLVGAEVTAIARDDAAGRLFLGTATQGVFTSVDGGTTFVSASSGLKKGTLTGITALGISPLPGARMIAAASGAGLYAYSGTTWNALVDGALDSNGTYTRLYDDGERLFAVCGDCASARSDDGGVTWQPLGAGETNLAGIDGDGTAAFAKSERPTGSTASLWAVSRLAGPRFSLDSGASWTATPGGNDYILPDGVIYNTVNVRGIDPVTGGRIVLAGSTTGLWKSRDGGDHWRKVSGPGSGLEATSQNVSTLLSTTTAFGSTDLLAGVSGTTNGGVYLSADGGEHWTQVNQGFDPANLSISTLATSSCAGCPVQYYSGSYGGGLYTRTIAVVAPPAIAGWCAGSTTCACGTAPLDGPTTGGQAFKLCGTGFQNGLAVEFDGLNATGCAQSGGTVLSCTATPAHLPGAATITVRNPDTRTGSLSGQYAYTGGSSRPGNSLRVAKSGASALLSWSCAGCTAANPPRIFRAQDAGFTQYRESYNPGPVSSYGNTGAMSSNRSYFWTVE